MPKHEATRGEEASETALRERSGSAVVHLEMGKAPPNSQTRESAFEALDDWLEDFQTVARVALNGNPQLLSSLGL